MRIKLDTSIDFTYTCPDGYEITGIGFCADFDSGTTENSIESTTTEPISIESKATLTKASWSAKEVKITCSVTSGTLRVASMKVYYKSTGSTGGDTRTNVTLSATDLTLTEGDTGKSTITSDPVIDGIAYTYTSGNESVATVATDGTVTAVAEGTAVITVKYVGNNEYKEATTTFNVTVNKKAVVGGSSDEYLCNDGTGTFNTKTLSLTGNNTTAKFNAIDGTGSSSNVKSIKVKEDVLTITSTKKITKVVIVGGDASSSADSKTVTITKVEKFADALGNKRDVECTSWASDEVAIYFGTGNNAYISKITVYYEDGTPVAPEFTTQPEDKVLSLGQELSLSVEASGNPAPTYQWYKKTTNSTEGGENIEGATDKTYTATQDVTGTAYYYCVATNSQGTVTSNVATVTVEKKELKLMGNDLNLVLSDGAQNLGIVAIHGEEVVEGITLKYTSDNTTVAKVDANKGNVTPVAVGTANITVTFAGNDTYKPADLTVVVTVTAAAKSTKPIIKVTSDEEGKVEVTNYTEENPYGGETLYIWLEKPADFSADNNYVVRYSIDNSKLDQIWGGKPECRTQTTYVYAQLYNKSENKFEGELLEVPVRFNFTLLAAFGSSDKDSVIEPGFQRMLTTEGEDKKPYIIATFGSKGDSGVWLSVSKDVTMGNSEISGYEYCARGNFDAKGEEGAQFAGNSMEDPVIENGATYYMEESSDNGTFKVPVSGSYIKFEPKVGGTINVILRQNGIIANLDDPKWKVMRMRPIFVCDETGHVLDNVKAMKSVNSQMNKDIFGFGKKAAFKADNGANPQTVEQSEANLKLYQQLVYNAGHEGSVLTPSADRMSASLTYTEDGSEVTDADLKAYWEGDAATQVTKNILYKYGKGWITLSKAYVRYSFDVEPGHTYFIMGHVTKVGACGYSFKRRVRNDAEWETAMNGRTATIDEEATELPEALSVGDKGVTGVNVTLKRKFDKGVWTSLVLPFSVSPYTLEQAFGEGTEVLHFDNVEGSKLNLVKHFHQMIVAGTPVLIKPVGTFGSDPAIENVVFHNVSYVPTTPIKEMTGGGWKVTGSYISAHMPENSYYVGYKTDGTGNNVYLSTKGKDMKGTRAWFERYDTSAPAKLTSFAINGVEDTTTAIDSILDDTDNRNANNGVVYNLNGQVVSRNGLNGLASGIYIMNGKKIIVK